MREDRIEEMSLFFNDRADGYDSHMLGEMNLAEFYDAIEKCFEPVAKSVKLLDLGCGTGLEIEKVFNVYPDAEITAVDLSENMLEKLKEKFVGRLSNINIICGSYFDVPLGVEAFEYVLSTYSLHHFSHDDKTELYKRIHDALKPGGRYIEGDYMAASMEEENRCLEENRRIREELGLNEGFYHYDTPFTAETQIRLLRQAGFHDIRVHKKWEHTTILICFKD